jgi:hypothetical protein
MRCRAESVKADYLVIWGTTSFSCEKPELGQEQLEAGATHDPAKGGSIRSGLWVTRVGGDPLSFCKAFKLEKHFALGAPNREPVGYPGEEPKETLPLTDKRDSSSK